VSTSEALSIIAAAHGKDSSAYLTACTHAAYGRKESIVGKASAILAQRPGRILSIAA
jgi:hypothetical protein